MLEIINHTALTAELIPGLDKTGMDYAVLIIKGRFHIKQTNSMLSLSEEPAEIVKSDVYYDETDNSSVRYESDIALLKRSTDIVLNGHAYASKGRRARVIDVGLNVNGNEVVCRVFGNRFWEQSWLEWSITPPQEFERMPMTYENAYGGTDPSTAQNENPKFSSFNPVGKGYIAPKSKPVEGLPLPNVEDRRMLISKVDHRPPPAGYGFISRTWQPRSALAGTYDEAWRKTRQPLLPLDFDDQFYNAAHPSLITESPLAGGETITLKNLSETGYLSFVLPTWKAPVTVTLKGTSKVFAPRLDTVVIEPDINNVLLTWRLSLPCSRQFLHIDSIVIGRKPRK